MSYARVPINDVNAAYPEPQPVDLADVEVLENVDEPPEDAQELVHELETAKVKRTTAHLVRGLALLCACSLSVGSH